MSSKLSHEEITLRLLEHVEENPDTTQGSMAAQLGVAIGSVNWYLKRLVSKGYIKVTRLQRRRLRYLITPSGISEKARLAYEYMRVSLYTYRMLRRQSRELLGEARRRGYMEVVLQAQGDPADILRLTALEMGIEVAAAPSHDLPVIRTNGTSYEVEWRVERKL